MGKKTQNGEVFRQMKFAIQYRVQMPPEEMAIIMACNISDDHEYKVFHHKKDVPVGSIPVGSVEWCEEIYGHIFKPDYYPDFLRDHLYRKIWEVEKWPQQRGIFVKPSDRHKKWNGKFTTGGYGGKKKGPYWCSERITILSEWRYYVVNGKVLFGEWYDGEVEKDAPSIDHIEFPSDYCGAVDFGETNDGKLALIEANSPYAVGWYGKDCKIYLEFVIEGYKYIQKQLENEKAR